MAKIWVKCLGVVHVEKGGELTTCRLGDWCKMSKGEARRLIAEGKVEVPDLGHQDTGALLHGAGVFIWGNSDNVSRIEDKYPTLEIKTGEMPEIAFPKTLIWDGVTQIKPQLLPLGYGRLEQWQLAVPVLDMTTLAQDIGTEEERARLKAVILDLRVPVYSAGAIFARRCKATKKLIDDWNAIPGNRALAFLEALYTNPNLFLSLPQNWVENG